MYPILSKIQNNVPLKLTNDSVHFVYMFSLSLIVGIIPLFFSHFFSVFGLVIGQGSSFERVKVILFCFLVLLALIEVILFSYGKLEQISRRKYLLFFSILFFPLLAHSVIGWSFDASFFWWSYEKHHGYFFFVALVLLFGISTLLEKKEYERILRISFFASLGVAVFALLEYSHIYSFFSQGVGKISWELGRTISTLGNPNYVAGYLLLHLPFLGIFSSRYRMVFWVLLVAAILTTGSLIGIALMMGYGIFLVLPKKSNRILILCSIFIIGIVCMYFFLPSEKLLSFTSRFVLMYETMWLFFSHPFWILFGNGSDSIITLYSGSRSPIINSYFPATSAIDSSHNIFLDILYFFGLPFFIFLLWYVRNIWRNIDTMSRASFALGILFFSLNVIVIVPLIPLIIILGYASHQSR